MKTCIHGHSRGRFADGRCKECQRLRNSRRYHATPKEEIKKQNAARYVKDKDKLQKYRKIHKERDRLVRQNTYNKYRARELIKYARYRAKQMGMPFNLDSHVTHFQNVIDAGKCEATGLSFDLKTSGDSRKNRNPYSPSLDRIKPDLGYVKNNVRVVIWAFNRAVGKWGTELYVMIAKAYVNNQR